MPKRAKLLSNGTYFDLAPDAKFYNNSSDKSGVFDATSPSRPIVDFGARRRPVAAPRTGDVEDRRRRDIRAARDADHVGGNRGFNVDLADAIGVKLKKKITVDSAQFSGLIPALQAGTYDFLIAPVTATPERADSVLFTEGYLNTDFQFILKKDTPDFTKLEDLKDKVISVNKGSAYDQLGARSRAEDRLDR